MGYSGDFHASATGDTGLISSQRAEIPHATQCGPPTKKGEYFDFCRKLGFANFRLKGGKRKHSLMF